MDSATMFMVFASQAVTEVPLLALSIAGATVCGVRLARTHRVAFIWSLAGFATLGLRSVLGPLGRFKTTLAIDAGARPIDLAGEYAFWAMTSQGLLLLGVAFLLVAVVSSRAIRREP
jgi:hypothetical protein